MEVAGQHYVVVLVLIVVALLASVQAQVGTTNSPKKTTKNNPTVRTTNKPGLSKTTVGVAGQGKMTIIAGKTTISTNALRTTVWNTGGVQKSTPKLNVGGSTVWGQAATKVTITPGKTRGPGTNPGTNAPPAVTSNGFGTTNAPIQAPQGIQWDLGYRLVSTTKLSSGSHKESCEKNQVNSLASRFNVATTRLVQITCSQVTNENHILVKASITNGAKPTVTELEDFKKLTGTNDIYFLSTSNHASRILKGSFYYTKRTKVVQASYDGIRWMGLSETHLVMIGMGSVILLLFIISVSVICASGKRSSGGSRKAQDTQPNDYIIDEEASMGADGEGKPATKSKNKLFCFQKSKKDDDASSVGCGSTDDESAYESTKDDEEGSEKFSDENRNY